MKNIILLLLLSWLIRVPVSAQGWLQTYYDYRSNNLNSFAQQTTDNGYILLGHVRTPGQSGQNLELRKTDVFGNVQWTYTYSMIGGQWSVGLVQVPSDGSYAVLYHNGGGFNAPPSNAQLLRVDAQGQFISDRLLVMQSSVFTGSHNSNLLITDEEDLLISSTKKDTSNVYNLTLTKLDLLGNVIWDKLYPAPVGLNQFSKGITRAADGSYAVVGYQSRISGTTFLTNNSILLKTDTAGTELWRRDYALNNTQQGFGVKGTNDGGFLILGQERIGFDNVPMAQKIDAAGNFEWNWVAPLSTNLADASLNAAVELPDGSFTCVGFGDYNFKRLAYIRLSATGQSIQERGLSTGSSVSIGVNIYRNTTAGPVNGYTIFGCDGSGPFLMAIDSIGRLYTNEVVGVYYNDYNSNCVQDAGEPVLSNQIILASSPTKNYYASTSCDRALYLGSGYRNLHRRIGVCIALLASLPKSTDRYVYRQLPT